jgi:hypothetical protein
MYCRMPGATFLLLPNASKLKRVTIVSQKRLAPVCYASNRSINMCRPYANVQVYTSAILFARGV